jgi:hypothetical protein
MIAGNFTSPRAESVAEIANAAAIASRAKQSAAFRIMDTSTCFPASRFLIQLRHNHPSLSKALPYAGK